MIFSYPLLALASFIAGIIMTLAGGGVFVTFPALLLTGLDPRAANITATIGIYASQLNNSFSGRHMASGTGHLSFNNLMIISLIGGIIGAILLLLTPQTFFAKLVPWLVLLATITFAWGSFHRRPIEEKEPHDRLGKTGAIVVQSLIAIYGGYFGGGMGLMMLSALTWAGMRFQPAAHTKNILGTIINTSAVGVFLLSTDIHWAKVGIMTIGSILGGLVGLRLLHKVNERYLRIAIVAIGLMLTVGLFLRAK